MKIGPIRFDKHTLGNLVKNVAPALAFTPLGVLGAGAAGALGEKMRGGSTGSALKAGLSNAALGGAGKLAAGAAQGGIMALRSGASLGSTAKAIGTETAKSLGADRFRSIGSNLVDPGAGGGSKLRTLMDLGKMGEGVYDRYQQNQDRKMAQDEYRRLQPLRDQAVAGFMDTSRPDLSSIFADEGNPQGRYRRVSVGSRGAY